MRRQPIRPVGTNSAVDELSERLRQAGFTEVERERRPSDGTHRPHGAIAAVTGDG